MSSFFLYAQDGENLELIRADPCNDRRAAVEVPHDWVVLVGLGRYLDLSVMPGRATQIACTRYGKVECTCNNMSCLLMGVERWTDSYV